jgi:hypothetical protein
MLPDRSPSPLSAEDWLPTRLRWIVALALVGLVVVTAAYAMAAPAAY